MEEHMGKNKWEKPTNKWDIHKTLDTPIQTVYPTKTMTKARKQLVSLASTPYYHCMMRCVRRAYLCGNDPITGRNFDHRKQLAVTRMRQLASIFAIDICAYAVMSNHYHVILHINPEKAQQWNDREVAERWRLVFKCPAYLPDWLAGRGITEEQATELSALIGKWRSRLQDISWFMRCMNEFIARAKPTLKMGAKVVFGKGASKAKRS